MSLQEEIDKKQKNIFTDSYPMSVGEMLSLYQDDEIDLHPGFQRFFRWSDQQKNPVDRVASGRHSHTSDFRISAE